MLFRSTLFCPFHPLPKYIFICIEIVLYALFVFLIVVDYKEIWISDVVTAVKQVKCSFRLHQQKSTVPFHALLVTTHLSYCVFLIWNAVWQQQPPALEQQEYHRRALLPWWLYWVQWDCQLKMLPSLLQWTGFCKFLHFLCIFLHGKFQWTHCTV